MYVGIRECFIFDRELRLKVLTVCMLLPLLFRHFTHRTLSRARGHYPYVNCPFMVTCSEDFNLPLKRWWQFRISPILFYYATIQEPLWSLCYAWTDRSFTRKSMQQKQGHFQDKQNVANARLLTAMKPISSSLTTAPPMRVKIVNSVALSDCAQYWTVITSKYSCWMADSRTRIQIQS